VERLDGDHVRFVDGTVEQIDAIIYCTGYKISFPFLDPEIIAAHDNDIGLYHRVVDPDHAGLFFIGLVQPLGAIMPLAEAQSESVADLLEGKAALPTVEEARREITPIHPSNRPTVPRLQTAHHRSRLPRIPAGDRTRTPAQRTAHWRSISRRTMTGSRIGSSAHGCRGILTS
jgi:Flavin-binding monooxygenase-like